MTDQTLKDEWVPVGLSADLAPETASRALIGATDLAVWRGKDGIARAWENRCPHRGMRLSFGFVRNNILTCLYHGWSYDGDGACAKIPAHPSTKPPKTVKATKFECAEAAGLIWVAPEGFSEQPPQFDAALTGLRTLEVSANSSDVIQHLSSDALRLLVRFDDGNTSTAGHEIRSQGPTEVFVKIDGHSDVASILFGVQQVSEARSLIHISASAKSDDTASCMNAANYMARRLRLDIETQTQKAAA